VIVVGPTLSLSLDPAQAAENQGLLAGAGTVSVAAAPGADLLVSLAADPVGEVTLPASVLMGAAASSVSFDLTPADNGAVDGNRIVTVTASAPGYNPGAAELTLLDDDGLPLCSWATAVLSATEEDVGVQFNVVLSEAAPQQVTVPYTVSGTATPGVDHGLSDGSVTIAAGQSSGVEGFPITYDTDEEGAETVIITMGSPTGAVVGAITVLTVTLYDRPLGGNDGAGGDPGVPGARVLQGAGCACRAAGAGAAGATLFLVAALRARRRARS
jgi:hypothetical protein